MKENKSFADRYGFAICAIAIFGMFVVFPIGSTIYQNNKVICSEEDTPYRTDYERVEENTGDISLSGKSKEEKLQNGSNGKDKVCRKDQGRTEVSRSIITAYTPEKVKVTKYNYTTPSTPQPAPQPAQVCNIKGNISYRSGAKIYHVPGGKYYNSTTINPAYGEKYFCSEAEAQANGFRRSRY